MGLNMYLYEKAREAHSQDIRREEAKERLLRHLPQHRRSMSRRADGKLGVHEVRGPVSLLDVITTLVEHEEEHCAQLEAMQAEQLTE